MIKNITINNTELFYEDMWDYGNLNEYYQYILNDLKTFFKNNNVPFSVNFGCLNFEKDINLGFQYEHTIITNTSGGYDCKIYNSDWLMKCDFVFEYSICNINHIKNYIEFENYSKISRYYPPLIYNIGDVNNHRRIKNCLTIHNISSRRNLIHQQIDLQFYQNECGNDFYSKKTMKEIMDKYKVLVNIHQIDEHLTLEELRVLPALMTGMLVISEDVPYKESIPYNKHIIWSSFDELPKVINDVLANYDFYRDKFLNNLDMTINDMKSKSNKVLKNIFENYIR